MKINLENWMKLQATREKLQKQYGYFNLTVQANQIIEGLDDYHYLTADDAQFYMLRTENCYGDVLSQVPYHQNEFVKMLEVKFKAPSITEPTCIDLLAGLSKLANKGKLYENTNI
jgi:hypothetical protein